MRVSSRHEGGLKWLAAAVCATCLAWPTLPAIAQEAGADVPAETPATDAAAPDDAAPEGAAEGAPGETAGETAGEDVEGEPVTRSTFWWLVETSGFIGLVLLLISIYFVALVIQLFNELRLKVVAPPSLLEQEEALLAKRDYNGIFQTAKSSPSDLGHLIAAGMGALSSGLPEAREAIDREGEAATVNMEKRISMLAVIGSLGPMIGLLGTLKGMIASFSVIAISGTSLKASEVAGGISEALVLTFEGVMLSVPAIYFYAFFKNRVATLSVHAQNAADAFLRRVHASARGGGAAPATAPAAPQT